ncbi:hypothetical protein EV378_4913 [Pseudonocardia endophytica]|uniref:Uncharacterized protein n=1 Tax=Pseudonocardia endophytica TaxID=401976 RepID=A0A4R1HKA6_PSEEN|nr:hypothetical protein EV378_4913 [Pseudonocardia endophytica]
MGLAAHTDAGHVDGRVGYETNTYEAGSRVLDDK